MKCPRCQHENPAAQKFCGECGTPLKAGSRGSPHAPSYAEVTSALSEALERETAAAEILRVISGSPTDVQPVFDAVAESAARLCDSFDADIWRRDGDRLVLAAHHGQLPQLMTLSLARGTVAGRSVLDGRPIHVADVQTEVAAFPESSENARRLGFRTILSVPLIREGVAIGTIVLRRAEVQLFAERQVALLQTFADQAVIAIENVRLFTELETRNNELRVALERQTATSEVLKVISRSTFDLEAVLATLVENATRLAGAEGGLIQQFDGEVFRLVAECGASPAYREYWRQNVIRPGRHSTIGRAALERRTIHIVDVLADPEWRQHQAQRMGGQRSVLGVPMLKQDNLVGVFFLWRTEVRAFTDKEIELVTTFADQAVIAIENVRLFNETKEALERQTATSEVLKVISRSAFDLQPVLETLVENATRLCGADRGFIFRLDGDVYRLAVAHGTTPEYIEFIRSNPIRPGRETLVGRTALERRTTHIPDVLLDPDYRWRESQQRGRFRTMLGVPMLREGSPIGVIAIWREEVQPFSDRQIELVTTFADQAVIAIENVRLFTELQEKNRALTQAHAQVSEALEQQTATSEILRVISRSPTDVQPVFDAIASSALRLCDGIASFVFRHDGTLIHLAAVDSVKGVDLQPLRHIFPAPPERVTFAGRVVATARLLYIADIEHDRDAPPGLVEFARANGFRSIFATPMLRDGHTVGVVAVTHRNVDGFTPKQGALLETFADQAVIAIENVRLFTELEEKNRGLIEAHAQVTEALEQQTATSEILRVISSSPTDVQPVFDAIAEAALSLCGAASSLVTTFDGELTNLSALADISPEGTDAIRRIYPRRPSRGFASGRAILTRAIVEIPDLTADAEYEHRHLAHEARFRSILAVPMLRDGLPIGTINVHKTEPGAFTDRQVALLQTFAEQAVIAIENVRLFKELQARTAELTRSVDQLTALGEVGRAVSSTLDLETVLTTIVSHAVQLSGPVAGAIYEYDEGAEEFHLRATENFEREYVELLQAMPLRKGEGVLGRVAVTRQPVQVPDITQEGTYQSRFRDTLMRYGYRALLAVPLLREGHIIGGLVINGKTPGKFTPEVIDLLRTFASQSALAIQNARLFREIADKSRQLEVASQRKSEFLANMSHELRTPLNAVIGFSEVLSERMFGDLNEKQEEYLNDIHASGQHLLSLINDILDLSKIEAGRMELELADFDLPTAIDNALTLVRERAGRHGIALHMTVDERLEQVRADERKVRQVVLNLLSNAIKFTPEGGRIEVRAVPVDGAVQVSVTDTGVGIAPEDQEAVFEEFRQVGSGAAKQEGTGLGLALSRKFVELHGGKIWVKSQVGSGSTFTFTVPLREVPSR